MINFEKTFGIRWTQDCQGKEDFDGKLASISTRIYARGGSTHVWGPEGFTDKDSPSRQHIRPSGTAHIRLFNRHEIQKDFVADTTEQLKADIEAWYTMIIEAVQEALGDVDL